MPTLATYHALAEEGVAGGLPETLAAKIGNVLDAGIRAVELAHRAGVPMAYGSDLLGAMHRRQLTEFALRAEIIPAEDLIRSATTTAASLIRREDDLGRVKEGYCADLIAFEGDPVRNVGLMAQLDTGLRLVIRGGVVDRSRLP